MGPSGSQWEYRPPPPTSLTPLEGLRSVFQQNHPTRGTEQRRLEFSEPPFRARVRAWAQVPVVPCGAGGPCRMPPCICQVRGTS